MNQVSLDGPALLQLIEKEQALTLEHAKKMYTQLPSNARAKLAKVVIPKTTLTSIFSSVNNFVGLDAALEFAKGFGVEQLGNYYVKFWEEETNEFVINTIEKAIDRFKGSKVDLVNLMNLPTDLKLGRELTKKLWGDVKEVAKCAALYTYGVDDIKKPIIQAKAFKSILAFYDTLRSAAPDYHFVDPIWFSVDRFKTITKNEPSHIKTSSIKMLQQVSCEWYQNNPTVITLNYFKHARMDMLSHYLYLLNDEELETIRQYYFDKIHSNHVNHKSTGIYANSHYRYVIENIKMVMAWNNNLN